jgi:hypothetical protein
MGDDRIGRLRFVCHPDSLEGQRYEENPMSPNDPSKAQGSRSARHLSDSERLYRQRLRQVLGINAAGVEVVLRLRNQVIALQTRVRQLETELAVREAGQNRRLRQHREACFEASWQEVVDAGERP